MKVISTLTIFSLLLFATLPLRAQQPACCETGASSHSKFAALGQHAEFRAAHKTPAPLDGASWQGKTVTFLTPDGATGSGYYLQAEQDAGRYLFVIHEWWGLNDHIRKEAERLYKALGNVHVLALDLYDGKVATDRESAAKYMQSAKEERIRAIIQGALNNVGPDAKVGTVGWCFGGGWSLQAAIMAGDQAAGCVMYYGMPEEEVEKLKKLETEVLGLFAREDRWINEEVVKQFAMNMEAAGKELTYKIFDAAHAFANPSRDVYDASAATEANTMALHFLEKQLSR